MEYSKIISGEPEITFSIKGTGDFVKIWIGYFDTLMQHGIPQNGTWEDFLMHYHQHDAFYDTADWMIPSLVSYIECLENIAIPPDESDISEIKQKILALDNLALDKKLPVLINYD